MAELAWDLLEPKLVSLPSHDRISNLASPSELLPYPPCVHKVLLVGEWRGLSYSLRLQILDI